MLLRQNMCYLSVSSVILLGHLKKIHNYQFFFCRLCAIFRHPRITDSHGVLLKPFQPLLWLGCGLIWLLMTVVLRFISFFEFQYHVRDNPHDITNTETERAWTWSDTFVIIMGAVSQQGKS